MTRKYSCHSKPRADAYWVQNGWASHTDDKGVCIQARKLQLHEDTMSRECQYRNGIPNDPQCEGCTAP